MAALSTSNFQTAGCYLPAIPPKPPKRATEYSRCVEAAPHIALTHIIDSEKYHIQSPAGRCRVRKQVGLTNRWRSASPIGADLLGSGQAVRSIRSAYNSSTVRLMTAEGPRSQRNDENSKPFESRDKASLPIRARSASDRSGSVQHFVRPDTSSSRGEELNNTSGSTIQDVFRYNYQSPGSATLPDVVLECFNLLWGLHVPFLSKSPVLSALYQQKKPVGIQLSQQKLAAFAENGNYTQCFSNVGGNVQLHACWRGHSPCLCEAVPRITVKIDDSRVTVLAVAFVLGHLYQSECQQPLTTKSDLCAVLLAANLFQVKDLQTSCAQLMTTNISSDTVVYYHTAAVKVGEAQLQQQCERWMELKLIPELSSTIHLKYVSQQLLHTTLSSLRFFTYDEYTATKVLMYWVFFQLNPSVQDIPTYARLLTYFLSGSKNCSLLERQDGRRFLPLFQLLRLNGITDHNHMQELQMMNIIPHSWMVRLLGRHYHAVHSGGDMSAIENFHTNAIRHGFILTKDIDNVQEVISMFGFHFELKATLTSSENQTYSFVIQRLRPNDPMLSIHDSERQTFSMRPQRFVQYHIRVQYRALHHFTTCESALLTHQFGLGPNTNTSKAVSWENLIPPVFVTFSMWMPPS